MKKIIRRVVAVENEQISILVSRASQDFIVCPQCEGEKLMFSPEKITEAANIQTREIFRLIEANEVHFIEREKIFVCLESLLNQENRK
mgnify:CR=1 FL=1